MRSLTTFTVQTENTKRDYLKYGSIELYTPDYVSQHNEYDYIDWELTILSIPEKYDVPCKVGDRLISHHNIYINNKNNLNADNVQSTHFAIDLDKGQYFVPFVPEGRNNLAYAYVNKEGEINTLGDVLLCEIPETPKTEDSIEERESGLLLINKVEPKAKLDLECVVAHSNPTSRAKGATEGRTISLADASDYVIEIDGKKFWRIFDTDIRYLDGDYMKPYGDSICIKMADKEHTTENGIYIPLRDGARSEFCDVIAMSFKDSEVKIGDKAILESLGRIEPVDEKEKVYYTKKTNLKAVL